MSSMLQCDVLISGMGGVGAEIAKNVVLSGCRSVTVHDTGTVTWTDMSSQFFVRDDDIGKNRAEVTLPRLAELNSYVPCVCHTADLDELFLKKFQVVVLTDSSLDHQLSIGTICHANNIKLVVADTRGLTGIFCDFGDEFTVYDDDGEEPNKHYISDITKCDAGVVTINKWHTKHALSTGDYIQFTHVLGMTELNDKTFQVTVTGPYTLSIGDTRQFTAYIRGGIVTKVKQPHTHNFKSLEDTLYAPDFVLLDDGKVGRPYQLHIAYQAFHQYQKIHGVLPRSYNKEDAAKFVEIARDVGAKTVCNGGPTPLDEALLTVFAHQSRGDLCPLASVIGGIAAQEVIKACTGKFTPIHQFLYFDGLECLPGGNRDGKVTTESCQPRNTRYDGQIAVFGEEFQHKLMNLKYHLIGAGAIGCEILKLWCMMGVACGESGCVHLSESDVIHKSNLQRQFLYRHSDIKKPKSITAAMAARHMNPDINITSYNTKVDKQTEEVYTDDFYSSLDGMVSAVDNIDTRQYLDKQCIYNHKPLLDSGTLGTKAHVQVILPCMTESYSSVRDPWDTSVSLSTMKNFPSCEEHTVIWARSLFHEIFIDNIQTAQQYVSDPTFIETTRKNGYGPSHFIHTLETVKKVVLDFRPSSFEDCVTYSRLLWEEHFNTQIQHLLHKFPTDKCLSSGEPFWTDNRRCPHPLNFDIENALHVEFVHSVAILQAVVYGIDHTRDIDRVKTIVERVVVPTFTPTPDITVQEMEATMGRETTEESRIQLLLSQLPTPDHLSDLTLCPLVLDIEDDTNCHMDIITAAAYLRAQNYDLPGLCRHKACMITGDLLPALVTTTATVSGLLCLEIYKIVQGHKNLSSYRNSFCNLALPYFGFTEPVAPIKNKYYDNEFTLWDTFEVQGEMTLQQFLDHFKEKYHLDVDFVSCDIHIMYGFFMTKKKKAERLHLTISELVSQVSKKPIGLHRCLKLEMCCNDMDGEEVEVPSVRYHLPTGIQTHSEDKNSV